MNKLTELNEEILKGTGFNKFFSYQPDPISDELIQPVELYQKVGDRDWYYVQDVHKHNLRYVAEAIYKILHQVPMSELDLMYGPKDSILTFYSEEATWQIYLKLIAIDMEYFIS